MSNLLVKLVSSVNISTLLLFALILLLSYVVLNWSGINKNLPPGPRGWPLVGYAPYIDRKIPLWITAKKLAEEYNSDIIHFSIYGTSIIFLNSYDVIKEAFSKREQFADKPERSLMNFLDPKYKGLLQSSGPLWKEQRRFTLSLLRDFGMGKTQAEKNIHEEIYHLSERLPALSGQAFESSKVFGPAVSNIINLMVFGQRFQYNDNEFVDTLHAIDELLNSVTQSYVRKLMIPYVGWMAKYMMPNADRNLRNNFTKWGEFISRRIHQHVEAFDGNVNDFIDGFLLEREKRMQADKDNTFTIDQLQYLLMDLFIAGSETTTTTMRWAVLYLIKHPELQEKIFHELLDNIGQDRPSSMSDKKNTPLTESFLLELNRFNTIVPLGTPHSCYLSGDTELHGYTIPSNVAIFANLGSMHRDPNIFPEPDIFKPDRFLDNGKVVNSDKVNQFGIGRRSCAGEGLARMEIYLLFTSLVLKYRFEKCGDQDLNMRGIPTFISVPHPYEAKALARY